MTRDEMIEAVKASPNFRYIEQSPAKLAISPRFKGVAPHIMERYVKIRPHMSIPGTWVADTIWDADLLRSLGIPTAWKDSEENLVLFVLSEVGFGVTGPALRD